MKVNITMDKFHQMEKQKVMDNYKIIINIYLMVNGKMVNQMDKVN